MKTKLIRIIPFLLLYLSMQAQSTEPNNGQNVLFIIVDDLRPEIGCYGAKHIHSPHIDSFAETGMVFERAYCQQSICNPSRTSVMTGMRPDTTGVVSNHAHFRAKDPDIVTLPQYFKDHGYHAGAIGKIYHGVFPDGASITKWDTMGDPDSWSVPAIRFGPRYYYTKEGISAAKRIFEKVYKPFNPGPNDWTRKLVFGPATEAPDVPDSTLYDGKVADAAAEALKRLAVKEKPFFLAVGFIKPHSPYIAPEKYFDLYDYKNGLIETDNVATDQPELVAELSARLKSAFGVESSNGNAPPTESFETSQAGEFDELESLLGKWKTEAGRAIIDDKHAKTGSQCLQLAGEKKTSVTLKLAEGLDPSGELSFWAERWTSRSPFSFRIEKQTGGSWKEIFNGDSKVKVGRSFLNHVKVPLGNRSILALRFTVTSPPNTGVLIDDIRIAPSKPQKVTNTEIVPMTIPALVGLEANPVAKFRVDTTGSLSPVSLTKLSGQTEGTVLKSLQFAGILFVPNADGSFELEIPAGQLPLEEGENFFYVEGALRDGTNIDHRVGAALHEVTFSNGKSVKFESPSTVQRLGVAVRKGGDDGIHTYRIPGLATTNKGALIGVYDARRRGGGDLPGDIDVGMSRSTDGGRTWEPMRVIMDMGEDPKWHYDGIGDPAVLVDRKTGTIWVAATWSHGNRSWRGSGPGLKPEETGQLMLTRSDDDGITWSKPINITKQIKRPEWCFILQGPGKGITMGDGTLVFAAQYQDPPEQKRLPHSTIIFSKDHGETWHVGTGAFDDTTEAQVVEIEPGVLMLNCRYNRKPVRVVMTTRDMGQTWQKHTTSERALIEPGSCMASLIDTGDWLLFSNPDSKSGRHHITIKASPDRGLTWPKTRRLLLDEGKGRGYSCMTMIDEKTVGILYEGSHADMTFQRIALSDLIGQQKSIEPATATPEFGLPQVFGNQMVLQRDLEIPVWGTAKPGAKVRVVFGNEDRETGADEMGNWIVRFSPRPASTEPQRMTIESEENRVQFTDILIGEVWVWAGQSNMAWRLNQSTHGKEEVSKAHLHPNIRLLNLVGGATGSSGSYTEQHLKRLNPENFSHGTWQTASRDSAAVFSAVSWCFGRKLQSELDVPVGLICPAVGGTPTEAWIPIEAFQADTKLQKLVEGNWLDNELLRNNVHPPEKKQVGKRLAGLAIAKVGSPLFESAERDGDSILVSFTQVGEGLKAPGDEAPRHFEIRGKNGVFQPADVKILGENAVVVSSPLVPDPAQVRYAWKPFPDPPVNLVNSDGLPASPFSTESENEVYTKQVRPNILFIVSEDNSDHLGCYGETRVHTPNLDKLANGGIRYTRAYVPYSVCSPSRAAFLTGLYTRQTGHIGLATHRFSMYRDFKTMPAYFQESGYYTGFLGKTHVNPERVVEDFVDHRAIRNSNFSKTISIEEYAQEADAVMQKAAEQKKPFMLIINYADAHRKFVGKSKNGFPTKVVKEKIEPYSWMGSDSPKLREEMRDYLNCINRLDEGVGMVMEKLEEAGVRNNTLVVYIADHGADFPRAKGSVYENGTRIPMIVNYPPIFRNGKVESAMVSTIDILPTMLRAAGLPAPEMLPGFALQDIDTGKVPPRKFIHTFTTGSSPNLLYVQFGIRDDRYKLVHNPDRVLNRLALSRYKNSNLPADQHVVHFLHPPEFELYDLEEDPDEWNNLADSAEHGKIRERLLSAMREFQREIKDPFVDPGNLQRFIEEQKEYQTKPYKRAGFRWPHLDMFERTQIENGSEL